jgi:hypothetical protein
MDYVFLKVWFFRTFSAFVTMIASVLGGQATA